MEVLRLVTCPQCHQGYLQEREDSHGNLHITCSEYPACRFESVSWEAIYGDAARFRHPVSPGQMS
ncbi:MAG: hypothetical protein C7B46_03885 [Sulfobacillus benefaciens]|uniref:Uncharacterized protein n=1 Tax=Sulfobacillus benefaciens TaxID=453960 RepID=A0A2T2XJH4_9FIRM|nr:MAG: hypothetical protein C7B46_03885 [Sulfobacillus benefaciens]